jgi:hypothetical protein
MDKALRQFHQKFARDHTTTSHKDVGLTECANHWIILAKEPSALPLPVGTISMIIK